MKKTKIKTVALIAHDNKKHDIVNWALANKETLAQYKLCGTGTTSRLIAEATGLEVKGYLSGPMGGDLQIGAKAAEGGVDVIIFFWDPLQAQPHARRISIRSSGKRRWRRSLRRWKPHNPSPR